MRSRRAAELLADAAARQPDPARLMETLCAQARGVLDASGLSVVLVAEGAPLTTAAFSGDVAAKLDTIQLELGEGPTMTAASGGERVNCPDIGAQQNRWPLFAQSAQSAEIEAVFAAPIPGGGPAIAVLNVYRDKRGMLNQAQDEDMNATAEAVGLVLLHAEAAEPGGGLYLQPGAARWIPIQQAAGMISAQLDVPPADALARLRAHAYVTARPMADLAADVLAGAISFTNDHSGADTGVTPESEGLHPDGN